MKDGGPAFPKVTISPGADIYKSIPGMSLRDYFAAKAIKLIIDSNHVKPSPYANEMAEWAYKIADAIRRMEVVTEIDKPKDALLIYADPKNWKDTKENYGVVFDYQGLKGDVVAKQTLMSLQKNQQ